MRRVALVRFLEILSIPEKFYFMDPQEWGDHVRKKSVPFDLHEDPPWKSDFGWLREFKISIL